jgi:hypothetical protein
MLAVLAGHVRQGGRVLEIGTGTADRAPGQTSRTTW